MIMKSLAFVVLLFLSSPVEAASKTNFDFSVAQHADLQANPFAAHDSSHDRFIVVWSDFRNKLKNGLDLYGRIVDSKGQSVSNDIAISSLPKGQGFGSAAFDPASGRYLVVWTDWRKAVSVDSDIYGRFVNSDGTIDGEEFVISAKRRVSQKFPAVAFDPFHRRFLIVWSDDREKKVKKVYGRFISPNGKLLGVEFRAAGEGGKQDGASLTFDSVRKRFLVVWRESETGRTPEKMGEAIYGAVIDTETGPLGQRFQIAYEKEGCLPPSLYAASYSPKDDLFLVSWTSGGNSDEHGLDVYGAFLRAKDGKLDRPVFPIVAAVDYQEAASVAYDSNRGRFLVVWYDLRRDSTAANMDIYGRYIYPDAPMSTEFLVSDSLASGVRRYPALSFSRESGGFLIVWEDGRVGGMAGRRIYGNVQ